MPEAPKPRNFYLNERHELPKEDSKGGGGLPKLAPIDWKKKQKVLEASLVQVHTTLKKSSDPTTRHRYYLLTIPEHEIVKESKNKKKAPDGTYTESINFAGQHSHILNRLGVDLIDVSRSGEAIVHATPESLDRLRNQSRRIEKLGPLDRSRWAALQRFDAIPSHLRIDLEWLGSLPPRGAKSVVEFQPLLRRLEVDEVIKAIRELAKGTISIEATGRDFSGRTWIRGAIPKRHLTSIAEQFYSVQSIHAPLSTPICVRSGGRKKNASVGGAIATKPAQTLASLPSVGVVDLGVPSNHLVLESYRRGTWSHPDCLSGDYGDHGSLVSSRVVFGDHDLSTGLTNVPSDAISKFLDIRVVRDSRHVDDKNVVDSIAQCINAFPDVRVFNLSFGDPTPYEAHPEVLRREKLVITQDIDNLIFARDVIIVIAAGNSKGIPQMPYPDNYQDPGWGLGHWAVSFNALICGSYSTRPDVNGLVRHPFAPSPFCRTGPGLAGSSVPDFSENGGNIGEDYNPKPGLGVYGTNQSGYWEDHPGTSFAAPILAGKCARILAELAEVCPKGSRPFSASVKALLFLTAERVDLPPQFSELAKRTLGAGTADAEVIAKPRVEKAVFLWQGVLESAKDRIRLIAPIPKDWISTAKSPQIEICVAWDTPVNAAVEDIYSSRNVTVLLRPTPTDTAIRPLRVSGMPLVPGYPLFCRRYDLKKALTILRKRRTQFNDLWVIELSYEHKAEYYPAVDFTPEQRVAVAFRLVDVSDEPVSPQSAVQSLPIIRSMTALSAIRTPLRSPVVIKSR